MFLTLTKTSAEIEDILIKARVDMLMNAPFFGNLATRLVLVDATDWCPTAATDGKHFYYNRHFTAALNEEECIWLMGHEILHCVYDHMDPNRRGDRIHQLWNVANDYVINLELELAKLGRRIRKEIIEVCFDHKYRDMMSEDVYDELYKEADEQGRIKQVSFDMHMEHEEGDDDGSGGVGQEANVEDGTKGPVPMTADEKEKIKQEFKSATIQAAKGPQVMLVIYLMVLNVCWTSWSTRNLIGEHYLLCKSKVLSKVITRLADQVVKVRTVAFGCQVWTTSNQ